MVKEFAFSDMLKRMGKGLYVYCVEALERTSYSERLQT